MFDVFIEIFDVVIEIFEVPIKILDVVIDIFDVIIEKIFDVFLIRSLLYVIFEPKFSNSISILSIFSIKFLTAPYNV